MTGNLSDPPSVATMTPSKWVVLNAVVAFSPQDGTVGELASASQVDKDTVYAAMDYFEYHGWVTRVRTERPHRFHFTDDGAAGYRRLVASNESYLKMKPTLERELPWLPHPPLQRTVLSCLLHRGRLNSVQVARQADIGPTSAYDMLKRLDTGGWLTGHMSDSGRGTARQRPYSLRPELIEPTRRYLELVGQMTTPGEWTESGPDER